MKIVLAALADSANISVEGNLNILGAFDSIAVGRFPAQHPAMVLAFRIIGEYDDQHNVHQINVRLVDEDGRVQWNAAAKAEIKDVKPGQFSHANQILRFRNFPLNGPGRFKFLIQIDDTPPHEVVFQVVQAGAGDGG